MNNPLVSIIVPVYNTKEFLSECTESLVSQTYNNIEIILVDDGSTDGSSELCDKLAFKDRRIRVIHQKNGGLSDARNTGIDNAKGDFISFVDSDDSVNPSFIKILLKGIKANDSDISVCGYGEDFPKQRTITGKEATIKLLLEQKNIDILAWNKLYKNNLFLDNGIQYPKGKLHEDNLTTYKLYSRSNKVSFIPKSLYNYRKREGSITNINKKETHLKMRELAARESIDYLKEDDVLKEAAEISLLLSKFAYLDNSLNGRIKVEYTDKVISWLKKQKNNFRHNQFLSAKLKTYLILATNFGGYPYKLFRRVKHE